MDQKEFAKQISTMQIDIFPLDRMLPLASVYKIFKGIYEKEQEKSTFLDNRKYKRLREGYFGLFVAAALDQWENKEHFLHFPSDPQNDINILFAKDLNAPRQVFNKIVCDVKEFICYEKSFIDFIEKKIGSKLNTYSIIIGSHRDITNFKPLYDITMNRKALPIYIVTAADPIDSDFNIGLVTMFSTEVAPIKVRINLKELLKIDDSSAIIFHNKLRDKLT